jgi:hypothetical protein
MSVTCRDEIQCVPCPDAHHYGQDHHEEDTIVRDVTPTLSKCTWDIWVRDTPVPIRGKNGWTNKGTYTATCFLEEDTKAGCKFPETCEDTMITIQGVIYGIQKAIRLGPETPVGPNGGIVDCTSSTTFRAEGEPDALHVHLRWDATITVYNTMQLCGREVTRGWHHVLDTGAGVQPGPHSLGARFRPHKSRVNSAC